MHFMRADFICMQARGIWLAHRRCIWNACARMRAALVECWRMDRASARQAFGGTMQDVIDRAGEPLKLTVDAGVGEQAALTDLCMQ